MKKLLFIPILLLLAFSGCDTLRYQVSSYQNDRAIVLDTTTGEAWVTDEYDRSSHVGDKKKATFLEPICYMYGQKDAWTYTPEEVRNCKNDGWWMRLKKALSKG